MEIESVSYFESATGPLFACGALMDADAGDVRAQAALGAGQDDGLWGHAAGDPSEALAYEILRMRARRLLAGEAPGHTLQATALVHEAYLRLASSESERWQSRAHFLAVASRAMRRILIDHARTRARRKRGGAWDRVTFSLPAVDLAAAGTFDPLEIVQFDRALEALEQGHARMGRVAEMRIFGGMTADEIADALGMSRRTVDGDWAFARRWLALAMERTRDAGEAGA